LPRPGGSPRRQSEEINPSFSHSGGFALLGESPEATEAKAKREKWRFFNNDASLLNFLKTTTISSSLKKSSNEIEVCAVSLT
jgi:hypothetical protein